MRKGLYSLRKLRKVLHALYRRYKKKRSSLSKQECSYFEETLLKLQAAILGKEKEKGTLLAKELEKKSEEKMAKSFFEKGAEVVFAVLFALMVAFVIRQMWFELYTIPTGSMRPTLRENDGLIVSKNAFGINLPLTTSHLYFNSDLLKRGSIITFTGKDMDIPDVDTRYFFLFPGKKQYVKRLIGKPGDTLYFYGGRIYGMDAEGNELTQFQESPFFKDIEHIPFIRFPGKVQTPKYPTRGIFTPALFHQMNEVVAKLDLNLLGKPQGEMIDKELKDYYELWGFENFAMARLVKEKNDKKGGEEEEKQTVYLELLHHPSFRPAELASDQYGRLRPSLSYSRSRIPLQEEHLKRVMDNLYTARFCVKKGFAYRLGAFNRGESSRVPLPGVPDGCYEFYHGKAYQIYWAGISKELPKTHSLYDFSIERVLLFFNLGIEFDILFSSSREAPFLYPSRYSYFRDGDLYVMGAPIFLHNDPILIEFLKKEREKEKGSLTALPHRAFIDKGPPLTGEKGLDRAFIKKYGITLPKDSYLALGDNHAMSADSREFGFVPEGNLRGSPSFVFWPFGKRWGALPQPSHPWISFPHLAVWIGFLIALYSGYFYYRKRASRPLKFK